MARIEGVDLPRNKRVDIALTYIFGIGRTSAARICDEANVGRRAELQEVAKFDHDWYAAKVVMRLLVVCLTSAAAQYRGYQYSQRGQQGGGYQQGRPNGGGFQQGGFGGGSARQGYGQGAQQGQFDPLGRTVPPGGQQQFGGAGRSGGYDAGYRQGGGSATGLRSVQDLPRECRDGLTFDGSGVYMDRGQEVPCDYSMCDIGSLDLSCAIPSALPARTDLRQDACVCEHDPPCMTHLTRVKQVRRVRGRRF